MTTRELLQDCAEDTHLNGDTLHARTKARLLRYLNQGMRRVLSMPGMDRLTESDVPFTFASVANQARYTVPHGLSLVRLISERTNDQALEMMPLEEYRRLAPDPSEVTGTPSHVVPIGRVAVATPVSDASELFVKSTSSSDVAQCSLRGTITGGYQRSASVTMTGTTAASLNTAITTWIDVADWFLGSPAVGTVTLHEDSGSGTELARIPIGDTRPRLQGFYLYPTPAAVETYYLDGRRRTVNLVSDDDEPPWEADFHWILSAYARMRQYEKTNDARWQIAKQEWEQGLKQLRLHTLFPPSYRPVAGVLPDRASNLGANYPSGRW